MGFSKNQLEHGHQYLQQCVHLKNCYGLLGMKRVYNWNQYPGLGPIPNQIPKLVYTVTDTETRFKRENRVTNFFHHKMATKLCCKTKFVGIFFKLIKIYITQEVRKHERNLIFKNKYINKKSERKASALIPKLDLGFGRTLAQLVFRALK